jgi:hypothetical protein
VLVELDPPHALTATLTATLCTRSLESSPFSWARVASRDIESLAEAAGLTVIDRAMRGGRWIARLRSDASGAQRGTV